MNQRLAAFAPLEVPYRLKDIDAALIADLYDVALNYGRDIGDGTSQRMLTLAGPQPIYVTVTYAGRRRTISVSTQMNFVRGDAESIIVFGTLAENSALVIDPALTVADLRAFIARIDAEYVDFRDPLTGARMRIASDGADTVKMRVDDLLQGRPKGVTFPSGTTVAHVASQLDRPDDVAFVRDEKVPCGFRLMYKKDVVAVSDAVRMAREIAAEFGLTSLEELDSLSPEDRKRLEEELFNRLNGKTPDKK